MAQCVKAALLPHRHGGPGPRGAECTPRVWMGCSSPECRLCLGLQIVQAFKLSELIAVQGKTRKPRPPGACREVEETARVSIPSCAVLLLPVHGDPEFRFF